MTPHNLDRVMFWTRNAEPWLEKLKAINRPGCRHYFSFTLTACAISRAVCSSGGSRPARDTRIDL